MAGTRIAVERRTKGSRRTREQQGEYDNGPDRYREECAADAGPFRCWQVGPLLRAIQVPG